MYREYVTLLQSLHRGTLSIQWYIAQIFYPTFAMSVFSRCSFKAAIFNRFFKVVMATSNISIYIYIYIIIILELSLVSKKVLDARSPVNRAV